MYTIIGIDTDGNWLVHDTKDDSVSRVNSKQVVEVYQKGVDIRGVHREGHHVIISVYSTRQRRRAQNIMAKSNGSTEDRKTYYDKKGNITAVVQRNSRGNYTLYYANGVLKCSNKAEVMRFLDELEIGD